jgi:hypothetical protein
MLHLQKVAERSIDTSMSSKNLSIVWAPNLLRTPLSVAQMEMHCNENEAEQAQEDHARLQYNLVQNTQIVQYLIDNAKWLFSEVDAENKGRKY